MNFAAVKVPSVKPPPRFDLDSIGGGDRLRFERLQEMIGTLCLFEQNFVSAFALYQSCAATGQLALDETVKRATEGGVFRKERLNTDAMLETNMNVLGWGSLAVYGGAIALYNFGRALESLQIGVTRKDSPFSMIDIKSLRSVRKTFEIEFPNSHGIRHVLAHAGEFILAPEEHGIKGPFEAKVGSVGTGVTGGDNNRVTQFVGQVFNDTLFVSYKGKVIGYTISQLAADRLAAMSGRVYAAFNTIPQKKL